MQNSGKILQYHMKNTADNLEKQEWSLTASWLLPEL